MRAWWIEGVGGGGGGGGGGGAPPRPPPPPPPGGGAPPPRGGGGREAPPSPPLPLSPSPPYLEPRRRRKPPAPLVDAPFIVKHRHKLQAVPLPCREIVGVVGGRDLDGARAKRHVDQVRVPDDGQLAPVERVHDVGADEMGVAGVVGVDGDRGVAEHRFGARRRDDNLSVRPVERVSEGRQHPEFDRFFVARHFQGVEGGHVDVVDFNVGDCGFEAGRPVDQPVVPVHQAVGMQPQKRGFHRRRQLVVHRKRLARPVGRRADAAQLLANLPPVRFHPRVHLAHKRVPPQVVPRHAALAGQGLLDDGLRRDPRVVGARHPERRPPAHAVPPHDRVLDGGHERVAQVQGAGDVWGGDDHDERFQGGSRTTRVVHPRPRARPEKAGRLPPRVCGRLDELGVVHFGQGAAVILFGAGWRRARGGDEGRELLRVLGLQGVSRVGLPWAPDSRAGPCAARAPFPLARVPAPPPSPPWPPPSCRRRRPARPPPRRRRPRAPAPWPFWRPSRRAWRPAREGGRRQGRRSPHRPPLPPARPLDRATTRPPPPPAIAPACSHRLGLLRRVDRLAGGRRRGGRRGGRVHHRVRGRRTGRGVAAAGGERTGGAAIRRPSQSSAPAHATRLPRSRPRFCIARRPTVAPAPARVAQVW